MMDDNIMKKLVGAAESLIQDTLTSAGYKISDMINSYPDPLRFIVVAAMQLTVNSLKAQFKPVELGIYEHIIGNTESIVLPGSFDPRRQEDPEAEA